MVDGQERAANPGTAVYEVLVTQDVPLTPRTAGGPGTVVVVGGNAGSGVVGVVGNSGGGVGIGPAGLDATKLFGEVSFDPRVTDQAALAPVRIISSPIEAQGLHSRLVTARRLRPSFLVEFV